MMRKRIVASLVGALLVVASVSSCANQSQSDESSTFERAVESGEVRVALASLMPDSGLTPNGEVTGYVPEVTLAALEGYGIEKLDGSVAEFQAFIPGLEANRWDLVTTGLTVTSERCDAVLFSNPLTVLQEALVFRGDNPQGIQSYEDFVGSPDLRLAVLTGSTQEAYALEQGVNEGSLVKVSDQNGLVDSVLSERADAFALGNIGLVGLLKPHADSLDFTLVDGAPKSATAVAFRKADADFRDKFNEKLEELRSSGELERLFVEWFGEDNPGLGEATSLTEFADGCE